MAIVQVRSTNPHFSFLIRKNPQSGMTLRSIRKGMAHGWYSDPQTYHVYFRDADNEVSYKQHQEEQFEYLNVSRYNTPLFPLNALGEFFSAPLKAKDERDTDGYTHEVLIPMIHIEQLRYVEQFEKHLKTMTFNAVHQAHKSYALTITAQSSLYELLHATSVLCLFLAMVGKEFLDVSDSLLDKYIRSVQVIDPPFYIRSLFVRAFLSSRARFAAYREALERTDRYSIRFAYGGTGLQRRTHIASLLAFDKSILDVGCGEGFYALAFAPKIEGSYYAVDIDPERLETVKRRAEEKELEQIVAFDSLAQFLDSYNGERVDVILTEVIEHMPQEEAKELIHRICRDIVFDRFVVTTPNADFNRYYELSAFRHEEHQWEMGETEFQRWLEDVLEPLQGLGLTKTIVAIGDSVDGTHTTQGVVLQTTKGGE